jgi:hypothetical protein
MGELVQDSGPPLAPVLPRVVPLASLVTPISRAALIGLLRTGALQSSRRQWTRPSPVRPWPR